MKKEIKTIEKDGYNGVYWPNPNGSKYCMIAMLGDDTKDMMAKGGVKWLQKKGLNVLTMSPAPKDYGHHNYPLERFEKALAFLKTMGNEEIGIMGASTTGMLALVAASYFSEITLTIAISPSDFVMEGFYQDGKDGAHERPGDGENVRETESHLFHITVSRFLICPMRIAIRNTGRKYLRKPNGVARWLPVAICSMNRRKGIPCRKPRK